MESKPWWQSRTLWGLAVALAGTVIPRLGLGDNATWLTDQAVQAAGLVGQLVGIGVAVYGRCKAQGPLTAARNP